MPLIRREAGFPVRVDRSEDDTTEVVTVRVMIGKGAKARPVWVRTGLTRAQQADTPVDFQATDLAWLPGMAQGRNYWLFREAIYSTMEELTPADVRALALRSDNRVRAELARARALEAQVESMEHGGRHAIPDDVKIHVWQRDGGRCVSCHSNRNLEYDHIIPVSLGGADTARNLQLLCADCNRSKGGSLV